MGLAILTNSDIVEQRIIERMDTSLYSREREILKNLFLTPCEPGSTPRSRRRVMDGLILVVHERNCIENRKGKLSHEEIEKLNLCDGEIRGMLYALGYDVRL